VQVIALGRPLFSRPVPIGNSTLEILRTADSLGIATDYPTIRFKRTSIAAANKRFKSPAFKLVVDALRYRGSIQV
jgi:hypothetical protein